MATIAFIGALEKEIMQIKEELSDVCEAQEAGLTVVSGELDGLTIVATTAGMGTVNAAAATQHLISKYAPQAVVFSGIAGGLNPRLHIDDVVIGKRLRWSTLPPTCLLSVGLLMLRQMRPLRTRAPNSSWSARLPQETAL